MRINCVKNVKIKRHRRTSEINFYVNNQHHAQERQFKQQMMNRVNQNHQLFSKSFSMINKLIIFFEVDTKRKFFFIYFRRIETTNYVMKRKLITK